MLPTTTSPPPPTLISPSPEEVNEKANAETHEEANWGVMPEPDISDVIIEDGKPVDNWISEKQQRLLTSSAYSSFNFDFPFILTANVGLFYADKQPPLVPDVMLSLGVACPDDWSQKKNRSYFVWNMGKAPDVAIEIVSNKVGNELGSKLEDYGKAGVGYYVVFDPFQSLSQDILRVYERRGVSYHLQSDAFLEEVNLGLTLWSGDFESSSYDYWLRWCDRSGEIFLTGDEKFQQEHQRAEAEKQRAEAEKQRADRLAQLLKDHGIDPNTL